MLDQHTIVYLYDAYFLPEHMYVNHDYVFVRHFGNLLTTKQSFAITVLIQDVQVRYVWLPSTTIESQPGHMTYKCDKLARKGLPLVIRIYL